MILKLSGSQSKYKFVATFILYEVHIQTPASIFLIRRDLVQVKCVKCFVSGSVVSWSLWSKEISSRWSMWSVLCWHCLTQHTILHKMSNSKGISCYTTWCKFLVCNVKKWKQFLLPEDFRNFYPLFSFGIHSCGVMCVGME